MIEKLENGKVRVYEDHTCKYYKDYTPEEFDEAFNSEWNKILREEITKEIDREIIDSQKEGRPCELIPTRQFSAEELQKYFAGSISLNDKLIECFPIDGPSGSVFYYDKK